MIKFESFTPADNEEVLPVENLELIELALRERYQEGLKALGKGAYALAIDLFTELLNEHVFTTHSTFSLDKLKLMTLKNLAKAKERQDDYSGALSHMIECCELMSELKDKDSLVWYTTGSLAMKCNQLSLARYCLEEGSALEIPNSWLNTSLLYELLLMTNDSVGIKNIHKLINSIPQCPLLCKINGRMKRHKPNRNSISNNNMNDNNMNDNNMNDNNMNDNNMNDNNDDNDNIISIKCKDTTFVCLINNLQHIICNNIQGSGNIKIDIMEKNNNNQQNNNDNNNQQNNNNNDNDNDNNNQQNNNNNNDNDNDNDNNDNNNDNNNNGMFFIDLLRKHITKYDNINNNNMNDNNNTIINNIIHTINNTPNNILQTCNIVMHYLSNNLTIFDNQSDIVTTTISLYELITITFKHYKFTPLCLLMIAELYFFLYQNPSVSKQSVYYKTTNLERCQYILSLLLTNQIVKEQWMNKDQTNKQSIIRLKWLMARYEFAAENFQIAKNMFLTVINELNECIIIAPGLRCYEKLTCNSVNIFLNYMNELYEIEKIFDGKRIINNNNEYIHILTVDYFKLLPLQLQVKIVDFAIKYNNNNNKNNDDDNDDNNKLLLFYCHCRSLTTIIFNNKTTIADINKIQDVLNNIIQFMIEYNKNDNNDNILDKQTLINVIEYIRELLLLLSTSQMNMKHQKYNLKIDLISLCITTCALVISYNETSIYDKIIIYKHVHDSFLDHKVCADIQAKNKYMKPLLFPLLELLYMIMNNNNHHQDLIIQIICSYISCLYSILSTCYKCSYNHANKNILIVHLEYRLDWFTTNELFKFIRLIQVMYIDKGEEKRLNYQHNNNNNDDDDDDDDDDKFTIDLQNDIVQFLIELDKCEFINRQLNLERDRVKLYIQYNMNNNEDVINKWEDHMYTPSSVIKTTTSSTTTTTTINDNNNNNQSNNTFSWNILNNYINNDSICCSAVHDTYIETLVDFCKHISSLNISKHVDLSSIYEYFYELIAQRMETNLQDIMEQYELGNWKLDETRMLNDIKPVLLRYLLNDITIHPKQSWIELGTLLWMDATGLALSAHITNSYFISNYQYKSRKEPIISSYECFTLSIKAYQCLRIGLELMNQSNIGIIYCYLTSLLQYILYLSLQLNQDGRAFISLPSTCNTCTWDNHKKGLTEKVLHLRSSIPLYCDSVKPKWLLQYLLAETEWQQAQLQLIRSNSVICFLGLAVKAAQHWMVVIQMINKVQEEEEASDDEKIKNLRRMWKNLTAQKLGLNCLYVCCVCECEFFKCDSEDLMTFLTIINSTVRLFESNNNHNNDTSKWKYNGYLISNYFEMNPSKKILASTLYPINRALSSLASALLSRIEYLFYHISRSEIINNDDNDNENDINYNITSNSNTDTNIVDNRSFITFYSLAILSLFKDNHQNNDDNDDDNFKYLNKNKIDLNSKIYNKNIVTFTIEYKKWKCLLYPDNAINVMCFAPWYSHNWYMKMINIYLESITEDLDISSMISFYDTRIRRIIPKHKITSGGYYSVSHYSNRELLIHTSGCIIRILTKLIIKYAYESNNNNDNIITELPDIVVRLISKACMICMQLLHEDIDIVPSCRYYSYIDDTHVYPLVLSKNRTVCEILMNVDIYKSKIRIETLVLLSHALYNMFNNQNMNQNEEKQQHLTNNDNNSNNNDHNNQQNEEEEHELEQTVNVFQNAVLWASKQPFARLLKIKNLLKKKHGKWTLKK